MTYNFGIGKTPIKPEAPVKKVGVKTFGFGVKPPAKPAELKPDMSGIEIARKISMPINIKTSTPAVETKKLPAFLPSIKKAVETKTPATYEALKTMFSMPEKKPVAPIEKGKLPKFEAPTLVKPVIDAWKDYKEKTGIVKANKAKDLEERVGDIGSASMATANLLFSPLTGIFERAKEIPGIRNLSQLLMLVPSVGSDMATTAYDTAIDSMVTSPQDHERLIGVGKEIASFAGMLAGGKAEFKKAKETLVTKYGEKEAAIIEDLATKRAEIIKETKKEKIVKNTLNKGVDVNQIGKKPAKPKAPAFSEFLTADREKTPLKTDIPSFSEFMTGKKKEVRGTVEKTKIPAEEPPKAGPTGKTATKNTVDPRIEYDYGKKVEKSKSGEDVLIKTETRPDGTTKVTINPKLKQDKARLQELLDNAHDKITAVEEITPEQKAISMVENIKGKRDPNARVVEITDSSFINDIKNKAAKDVAKHDTLTMQRSNVKLPQGKVTAGQAIKALKDAGLNSSDASQVLSTLKENTTVGRSSYDAMEVINTAKRMELNGEIKKEVAPVEQVQTQGEPTINTVERQIEPTITTETSTGVKKTPTGSTPSKIALSMSETALDKGVINTLSQLAGFDKIKISGQLAIARQLFKNPEKAMRILEGKESLPKGLNPATLLLEAERVATLKGDGKMMEALLKSPLASETSLSAQTMRVLQERDPDGAIAQIESVKKAWEETAKKKLKGQKPEKAKANIKEKIQEAIDKAREITEQDLLDHIDSLSC